MAIDGVFIHYLVQELNNSLQGGKINKINQPTPLEVILNIRSNHQNWQFLLSSDLNFPCCFLSAQKRTNPEMPFSFCMNLRKYLERGIIEKIWQVDNDRIVVIDIRSFNELGDECLYHLFLEIMGRNSNLILTTSNLTIIDSIRKLSTGLQELRTIIPKAPYRYPGKQGSINPFGKDLTDVQKTEGLNQLEGISPLLKNAINFQGSVDRLIYQETKPVLIKTEKKPAFYVFDLPHLEGERKYYSTISSLLEDVKSTFFKETNPLSNLLSKVVRRELAHQKTKLANLKDDLTEAEKKLETKNSAMLLQANLYRIKPGDEEIVAEDFYHNGEPVTIKLNPQLSPSQNLNQFFAKIKKSENALEHLTREIAKTENEIIYLESLLDQIKQANDSDLQEIKAELLNEQLLSGPKIKVKQPKSYLTYQVDGATIWVGKNNLQNNFLTHTLAQKSDYWFHVQKAPSAHVILRAPELTEKLIRICAHLSALHSSFAQSSSVPVDYTLVKNVKKVPGQKGSFVTYTNQKTIFIDPDWDTLKKLLGLGSQS